MLYRTKIVEIEAHYWDGDQKALFDWANNVSDGNGTALVYKNGLGYDGILEVHTLEGIMTATRGDFVICGLEGEFYFCKPAIFHKKYEPAPQVYRFSCCGRTDGETACQVCIPY